MKKRADWTDFERTSIKEYKERFIRWQNKQIDLLTFCINLNFTLSVAICGFIIANLDKPIFKDKTICGNYPLIKTALYLIATATTVGILALITRLNDFRLTKKIIQTRRRIFELKNEIQYEDYEETDIEKLKTQKNNLIFWTTILGKVTWFLFYAQMILLLIIIWIIATNG